MFYIKLFIYYLLAINVITLVVYGIDKLIAVRNGKKESSHHKRSSSKSVKTTMRVPEATLLMLAVIGGSIGAFMGMVTWRHKTKHLKFKIGVPAIIILQVALLVYVYVKY